MKKKYDSCVFKREWIHYKTCFECTAKKTCVTWKPNWFAQLGEAILVGLYRFGINRKLRKLFIRRK